MAQLWHRSHLRLRLQFLTLSSLLLRLHWKHFDSLAVGGPSTKGYFLYGNWGFVPCNISILHYSLEVNLKKKPRSGFRDTVYQYTCFNVENLPEQEYLCSQRKKWLWQELCSIFFYFQQRLGHKIVLILKIGIEMQD